MSPFQARCLSLGFFTLKTGFSRFPGRSVRLRPDALFEADLPCDRTRFENMGFFSFRGEVLNRPSRLLAGLSPLVFWPKAGITRKAKRITIIRYFKPVDDKVVL
jgi:hypothetical protein